MSAPVNNGIEIKPIMPMMAIITAPQKALAKFLTSKLGTSAAASIIINALITNANIPKVTTDSGAVKNQSAGRMKVLIKPSTMVAIKKAGKFLVFMPETIKEAKPRPIAVANQMISSSIIV